MEKLKIKSMNQAFRQAKRTSLDKMILFIGNAKLNIDTNRYNEVDIASCSLYERAKIYSKIHLPERWK